MPEYFDIHSHLNFSDYDHDRNEVIEKMKNDGVATITVGTNIQTSREAVLLASKHDHLYAAIGIHPADGVYEFIEKEFEEIVVHPKVVAIGECGLDTFRFKGDLEAEGNRQKALFEMQIQFAAKHGKPLMIHARNSYDEIYEILKSSQQSLGEKVRGNMHFFAGNVEQAKKFLDIGFTLSFTGVITFVNDYSEVVKFAPLDRIMSETDSPYVAPIPFRGSRNEPGYVAEVVKKIAEIKGLPFEQVKLAMVQNAQKTFGL